MVYLIILVIWLSVNWIVDCYNACFVAEFAGAPTSTKVGKVIGTTLRYATWAWLIYMVAMAF